MTHLLWKCLAILATLILVGCAARNADQGLTPDVMRNTGLVFASVSTSPAGGDGPVATFKLRQGGFVKSREEQIAGLDLKPSELEGDFGRLVALELPAGPNSLTFWSLTYGVTQYSSSRVVPEIRFIVEPGKALYLGNLHLAIEMGTNAVNQRVINSLSPEIRDRRERDVALFKSRYPLMDDAVITAQQPFLGKWSPDNPFLSP